MEGVEDGQMMDWRCRLADEQQRARASEEAALTGNREIIMSIIISP